MQTTTPTEKHPSITATRVMRAVESDECTGFCIQCGATAFGIEPDARGYKCDDCGAAAVYGAEELLFMFC